MSKLREAILYISIAILLILAAGQAGFILGEWEKFDHEGRLLQHETKIQVLQSDMKVVKEKARIP